MMHGQKNNKLGNISVTFNIISSSTLSIV